MDRYDNIPIIQTKPTVQYPKVIRYRSSTRYPDIPLSDADVFLSTIRGDRLDNLAFQYYRDSTLYWIIAAANPELTLGSLFPPLGVQIRIPVDVDSVITSFNNLNNG